MKNPYLISLRPDTSGPTVKCVSAIGEGQTELVSFINAPIIATPNSRFNLMRNPFAEADGSLWTYTNCIFAHQEIRANGEHTINVAAISAGAEVMSPVCRFKGAGPHTMSINLCNDFTTPRTATVTFMANLRSNGGEVGGTNVSQTVTVPPQSTVAVTQTVTPLAPWFAIKISNLVGWTPALRMSNPMVNVGSTLDEFFSYRTPARQGLPNPGKVESSAYRFTCSYSSFASASEVGWMFHPVSKQWAVNTYFRAGVTGYTLTNCTADNDDRYVVFYSGGSLGMVASAANARIAQTITVTAGLRAVMMAFVLNRNPASRQIQLRAGGVVVGQQIVPGGQEALIFGEYTGTGAAVSFDLNVLNSTSGGNELTVVHYFGLVTANGYFPAPLPFLDPYTGQPYRGTWSGAYDISTWTSDELYLAGNLQSHKSPEFWYQNAIQGSVIMRHYDLPQLPGAADTKRVMYAMNPSVGTHEMLGARKITPRVLAHSIKTSLAAAQVINLGTGVGPLDNGKCESLVQWSTYREQQMVNQDGSIYEIHGKLTPPMPTGSPLQPDYVLGSNGVGNSQAAVVTAVMLGQRWLSSDQFEQLIAQDVWTHNTPVLPSGKMRIKAISGGRMRIRVVGSGSADA